MKDLIKNVHTLFDESPPQGPQSPLMSSPDVPETMSATTIDSLLSPEFPAATEVQAMSSASQQHPGLVVDIPMLAPLSFPSLLLDAASESESHFTPTPSPTPFISPLLRLPSSQTPTEGVDTPTQEQVIPKAREINAVETLPNSILVPPEVSPQAAPSPVAEWRLQVPSQLPLQLEAPIMPQSPTESMLSSTSDCPHSSATSLQTTLG